MGGGCARAWVLELLYRSGRMGRDGGRERAARLDCTIINGAGEGVVLKLEIKKVELN